MAQRGRCAGDIQNRAVMTPGKERTLYSLLRLSSSALNFAMSFSCSRCQHQYETTLHDLSGCNHPLRQDLSVYHHRLLGNGRSSATLSLPYCEVRYLSSIQGNEWCIQRGQASSEVRARARLLSVPCMVNVLLLFQVKPSGGYLTYYHNHSIICGLLQQNILRGLHVENSLHSAGIK